MRNARRAFPLLPAALASVPFGFVLVRVRRRKSDHLFLFGMDNPGAGPRWLAEARHGITEVPFDIGKPQLRPPRCDTRVAPEEKRRFLARRAQETEQRRALFNAETDAETTEVRFQNYFMNSFHFRRGWKYYASCPLHTILFAILTCAQRTRVHFCPQHWLLCHLGLY